MDTKHIGDVSTISVAARLLQCGLVVLMPIGDNQRYDLVIETNGGFKKIQCKTGRIKKNSITFATCSTYSHQRGTYVRKDYRGQVDYFGVFCSDNATCYLVPVSKCGKTIGTLRFDRKFNSMLANDYEIGRVAESGLWHSPAKTEHQLVSSVQIAPLPPDSEVA